MLPIPDGDAGRIQIRVEGTGRFAQVPEWVVASPGLSDRAVRMWAALWLCADWTTGVAETSRARLAGMVGKSVDTVDRALKDLVASGAVSVVRHAADNRSRWNEYVLHWADPTAEVRQGGAAETRPRGPQKRGPYSDLEPQKPVSQHAAAQLPVAEQAVRAWCELREVPPTRQVLARWVGFVSDWIAAGGPVDADFLAAAAADGIRTPGGWPSWALNNRPTTKPTADRWSALASMIESEESDE